MIFNSSSEDEQMSNDGRSYIFIF